MTELPSSYGAMALVQAGSGVLQPITRELQRPGPRQLLLRVQVCGVCRTDLHIVDGELAVDALPRVPGHEVVGRVAALGPGCARFALGQRLGVPWLAGTCGICACCNHGRENLCAGARFTGLSVDGGYAEYLLADERHCVALPARYCDEHAAPLLCAGLIGWRALQATGNVQVARTLALYGFGAAAHLIAQVALAQGRQVFAFTRPGDDAAQALARSLGVHWAGGTDQSPPAPTDAAILFAPAGELVPLALQHSAPGATVVCAGIHMSDIPRMPYRLLWGERVLRSVANLTHRDAEEFMAWAALHPLRISTQVFALHEANAALAALREGRIVGAAVLRCSDEPAQPPAVPANS